MATNKLKLAFERKKAGLRAEVLRSRIAIENNKDRLRRTREELRAMQPPPKRSDY